MPGPTADIAAQISRHASARSPFLVGIDGLGGAGKSSLTYALRQHLERNRFIVATVCNDDFYLPSAERRRSSSQFTSVGVDFDWRRFRDQVLLPLRANRPADYMRYDWSSDRLAEHHQVQPKGIVLIEGVYCTRAELREFFDFRIWVDCPSGIRLSRGLARDGEGSRRRWLEEWMPQEDRYVEEHKPQACAHIVVNGGTT
jgi:uridine kinase